MSHDYAAECQKWRDVFGHMGTADEIGNEWVRLRDQNEILLRTVETIATGATSIEQCKQLARSVTSTAVHSPDSDMMVVAKAAGYAVSYDHMLDCYFINGAVCWDPRVDDGDALRLAVRLGINVVVPNNHAFYTDDQLLAETRRMIVAEALNRAYQIFPDRIEFKELVDALNSQKVTK